MGVGVTRVNVGVGVISGWGSCRSSSRIGVGHVGAGVM